MIDDEHSDFTLQVIGAASGLGAPDHRCQTGPEVVWRHLDPDNPYIQWHEIIRAAEAGDDETVSALSAFSRQLADSVAELVRKKIRVAVIGGDHSCAIGTWSGVAKACSSDGEIGLIWIDAHMDAHTPTTSPSQHWHGMPVACLLGQGEPSLIKISGQKPAIKPQNICLIGIRSFEASEQALLQRLGVRVFTMDDVHRLGFEQVMQMAKSIVSENTVAYGVSIDLDGLDPADAPAVGSPVVGGIRAAELLSTLAMFKDDQRMAAIEVAEFNPVVDKNQLTLKLIFKMFAAITGVVNNDESND